MKKSLSILLVILILSFSFSYATTIEEVLGGNDVGKPIAVDNSLAGRIIGAMQWAGYAIAVGMIVYIGIKYLLAAADEKADLKRSLVRFVTGAVIIAAAVTFASWFYNAI